MGFTDTEILVTYLDYGNEEWIDPLSIQIVDSMLSTSKLKAKTESKSNDAQTENDDESKSMPPSTDDDENAAAKRGIRIGDKAIEDDVSNYINNQLYKTSRFLTDTVRGQKDLSEFGLSKKQQRKVKARMKEEEKVLRFDPLRYLKSIRQKARPEWFDVRKHKGITDVIIENYTMFTLDEKMVLLEDIDIRLIKGERYGFIGMNGAGKTTLLRRMSRYDIKEFPAHLRILHVEQEILGDNTTVMEYVLSCDVVRVELLERERKLTEQQKVLEEKEKNLIALEKEKAEEKTDSKVETETVEELESLEQKSDNKKVEKQMT